MKGEYERWVLYKFVGHNKRVLTIDLGNGYRLIGKHIHRRGRMLGANKPYCSDGNQQEDDRQIAIHILDPIGGVAQTLL